MQMKKIWSYPEILTNTKTYLRMAYSNFVMLTGDR